MSLTTVAFLKTKSRSAGAVLAGMTLLWWVALGQPLRAQEKLTKRPLLLVVVDTLRFDAGRVGTDRWDAAIPALLRRRGWHFVRAIAAGNWTRPSLSSLMSGYYPSEWGILAGDAEVGQPPGPMLAERLKKAGFATAAVVSNPSVATKAVNFAAGFDSFDAPMPQEELKGELGRRNATETTQAALEQLSSFAKQRKPWFLWVHYMEPHGPYIPPARFLKRPRDPGPAIPVSSSNYAERGALPAYQLLKECQGRNDYLARYQASADYALSEVNRLLKFVDSSPRLRDAVVVFTSDHGEFLGEQNYWFQHGTRIDPAVVNVPLVIATSPHEALRYEHRGVGNIDLVATLLPLVCGETANDTRGENLFALPPQRRNPLLTEYLMLPDHVEIGIFSGNSLIVRSNLEPPSEFLLEGRRWSMRAATPEAVQETTLSLQPYLEQIRQTPVKTHVFTPEEVRKLRTLGYLGNSGESPNPRQ